jgi:hypothetical protein
MSSDRAGAPPEGYAARIDKARTDKARIDKARIDEHLVRRLLTEQFPRSAGLR